ncbi:hypothetical protein CLONEX_00972 [[Clostridium] nexile DSM 1787]|nr:hypothetical protein CLONEX_00972 [[Clostridium] nexile DSM 1787]
MSSKINLQTCEYARKSSIFQDNQLIYLKKATIVLYVMLAIALAIWYNNDVGVKTIKNFAPISIAP